MKQLTQTQRDEFFERVYLVAEVQKLCWRISFKRLRELIRHLYKESMEN